MKNCHIIEHSQILPNPFPYLLFNVIVRSFYVAHHENYNSSVNHFHSYFLLSMARELNNCTIIFVLLNQIYLSLANFDFALFKLCLQINIGQ